MSKKMYEMSREEVRFNRIKKLYEALVSDEGKCRKGLVEELLSMQQKDGSWAVIETRMCDSDIRVHYVYFPTYYATAALICADLFEEFVEGSKGRRALMNGLEIAKERSLMGHGFDATRQMLDALAIYKRAGLYRWMNRGNNSQNDFCNVVHERIAKMKEDLLAEKTVSDWDVDFRKDYEREVADFEGSDSQYVWYACYGSNVNKSRFMKYINACGDKTPPMDDRPFCFPHNIYFAKSAVGWNGGGKAFLDDTTDGKAYGRVYKITQAQFEEIKRQEGRDYTKLLYFGKLKGIPVYSFTDIQKNKEENVPSDAYYQTILEGLQECYEGIMNADVLKEYLIRRIFPEKTFEAAKAIKVSEHYLTNEDISNVTGLAGAELVCAVQWLVDHKVIRQDSRSICAGHSVSDQRAYFYTVEGHCGRDLLSAILEAAEDE